MPTGTEFIEHFKIAELGSTEQRKPDYLNKLLDSARKDGPAGSASS